MTEKYPVQALHHITAVSGAPQENLDFYHNQLGQRFVKRTVNFDDPTTYHLYYGDKVGTPGTAMTFFPWRGMRRGRPGNGEVGASAYTIPEGTEGYWIDRLKKAGVSVGAAQERFGAAVIPFHDPAGMQLELIVDELPSNMIFWEDGPVPLEKAIHGFHSVTLWVDEASRTADLLTNQLGYTLAAEDGARSRFIAGSKDMGHMIDLLERPGQPRAVFGSGSVHHIAFRTVDDAEQIIYQRDLRTYGMMVTDVRDRQYFHSIYFREPNGVLFEIATDAPGFLYDEAVDELGQSLKLPIWHEPMRDQIEALVAPLEIKPVVRDKAEESAHA